MQTASRTRSLRSLVLVMFLACLFALPAIAPARGLVTDRTTPTIGTPVSDLDGGFYRAPRDTFGGPGGGTGGSGPDHGGGGTPPDGDPDDTYFRVLRGLLPFISAYLHS